MTSRSITSPADQSATFIELFFDLVFVFSVTQVVGVLHGGFDLLHVGRAVLVFWMVWWAWTQFTWALNAADTTHPAVEIGVLIATAIAFFMAVALPGAFEAGAVAFALPYVLVRVVGLVLYAWVSASDPTQRAAVRVFSVLSVGGLVAVLAGSVVGGTLQYWLWGLAILLDVLAAGVGGNVDGWNLHPEHFGERHGLFVIIALGESLIVAAGGLVGAEWNGNLVTVVAFGVAITCVLWWLYFSKQKPVLDAALESQSGAAQSCLARDAYSLVHYLMVCGIIGYAAALEEAILHPDDPLSFGIRVALASSLVLFIGGMVAAVWRATRTVLVARFVIVLVTAGLVIGMGPLAPRWILAMALVGVAAIAVLEESLGASGSSDDRAVSFQDP